MRDTHAYAELHQASLVVVHSTVPVGVCDANGWVHSPIRGKHPDLADGISVFVKHAGGDLATEAADLFKAAGLRTMVHARAATTELGKLVELAAYGAEVRIEKEIHALCTQHELPFDEVYTDFFSSYNDGWDRLGHPEFVKPVLRHVPGPLGGHCVAQNTPLLGSRFFDDLVGPISPTDWKGEVD